MGLVAGEAGWHRKGVKNSPAPLSSFPTISTTKDLHKTHTRRNGSLVAECLTAAKVKAEGDWTQGRLFRREGPLRRGLAAVTLPRAWAHMCTLRRAAVSLTPPPQLWTFFRPRLASALRALGSRAGDHASTSSGV